jgi:hypothetical protein
MRPSFQQASNYSQPLPQTLDNLQDGGGIRQCAGGVLLAETDDAVLIYDEHGTEAGTTLLIPQTIIPGDFAFGMPVRQLWVGEAPHRRGPRPVGRHMITTDAQHLGLPLLELAV